MYYLNIKRCGGGIFSGSDSAILLYRCSVPGIRYYEKEPNNSEHDATLLLTDEMYFGTFDTNDDDYFWFTSDNYKICIYIRTDDQTVMNQINVYLRSINNEEKALNFIKDGDYL